MVAPATELKHEESPVQDSNANPEVGSNRKEVTPEPNESLPEPVIQESNTPGPLNETPLDILAEIFNIAIPPTTCGMRGSVTCAFAMTVSRATLSKIAAKYSAWVGGVLFPRVEYKKKEKKLLKMCRGNKKKYEEWLEEENAKLKPRQDTFVALIEWEKAMEKLAYENDEIRRVARKDAFIERLIEIGYETVMTRLKSEAPSLLEKLPGIRGVNPFTEEDWETFGPKQIESLKAFEERSEKRARAELISIQTKRLLGPVYDYYISHHRDIQSSAPVFSQLAKLEPFRGLVYDAPADRELTQADFIAHLDAIPKLIDSWKEEIAGRLLALLDSESEGRANSDAARAKGKEEADVPVNISVLDRATTIFECNRCFGLRLLLYPFILTHGCLIDYTLSIKGDHFRGWNERDQVKVHEQASRYAKVIIGILGQDPDTVTWKQLDKDNQRVECTRCRTRVTRKSRNRSNRLVMNWRHAILHEIKKHSRESEDSCETGWQALDAKSLAITYSKERAEAEPNKPTCVECKLCSIEDDQVVYPPRWLMDSAVLEGAETCQAGHDLSMGVYNEHPPAANFSSRSVTPQPVRIP
ncbi:hypothetical protein EST38_g7119 [Candolleomyces aberdarensis]|uniref:Uncharacterized protein n=1 Tax=Candolleomyces aberdarensis TaxID=2316362 RepID=A0A4Q2DHT1_9AGAR|nr:hypothetical protein EST38_g7119 [Candolleomyces aberdarensis]